MRTVHQSTYQNYIAKSTYLGNTINWTIFHDYCNKGDLDNMNSLDEEENGKNANTITISKSFHSYTTSMTGLKYKLAHKRVGIKRWSSTENTQREPLIKILEEYIAQLKREMVEEAAEGPTPTIYYRT